jgi:hypothetical protein
MASTQFVLDHDGNAFAGVVPASSASVQITPIKPSRAAPSEARSAFRVTVQRHSSPDVAPQRLAFEELVPAADAAEAVPEPLPIISENSDRIQHSYMTIELPASLSCLSCLDGPAGDVFACVCLALLIATSVLLFPTTAVTVSYTGGTNRFFPYLQSVFILSYAGFLYWFSRHLETKVLLRSALLTFEACYLCMFASLFVFATCYQAPAEFQTRAAPVGMSLTMYILARISAQMLFVLLFFSSLLCDALIRVSVAAKLWVLFFFRSNFAFRVFRFNDNLLCRFTFGSLDSLSTPGPVHCG